MTTYTVTRKSDSQEVYRYSADAPIEWSGMEFATHEHAPEADTSGITDVTPTSYTWTKLEYLRRFTQAERIAIRAAAKAIPELEDYLQLLELASEVRSDDPDIMGALQMLEAGGLIAAGRAQEILG